MKKFYAFAAAAMTALAVNAAEPLYICGGGEGLEWNPATPAEVPFVDGKYVMEVTNLENFKLSTKTGEWADFNGACLTCDYGYEPGVEVKLEAGDGNIDTPWKGDYTITVAGDLSTIVLTTTTPKPDNFDPYKIELSLRGDINGWAFGGEWMMTEVVKGNVFKFECGEGQSIKQKVAFKIADEGWKKYNIGSMTDAVTTLYLGDDNEVSNGAGGDPKALEFSEDFTGVLYLVLNLDDAAYIWASNDKDAEPDWLQDLIDASGVTTIAASNNTVAKYYNLQGVQVANPENGLFIVVKGDKVSKVLVK